MTFFRRWSTLLIATFGLAACSAMVPRADLDADVIVVGDSILAWHRSTGRSIPSVVAQQTGLSVTNHSINGARFLGSNGIPTQYTESDWDWVIVDGGGNDLLMWCGTPHAQVVLDNLISADGTAGAMPNFISRVAEQGAQVILLGYYPISDQGGPFVLCQSVLDELAVRQERFAATNPAVSFVDSGQVIGASDSTAYGVDLVHLTPRGSVLVGQLISSNMRSNQR